MDVLKSMIEKRGNIVAELELLQTEITEEKRDADEELLSKIETKSEEIRELDEIIKKLEDNKNVVEINEGEERDMEKKELELRGLENFIKGETRADESITVTNDGKATIPTLVENTIVEKMDMFSDVFASVRKLPSQAGSLKIPRENTIAKAGFVGELEDVSAIKLDLGEVELTQKRVGAFTRLTNQLVNDSAVDIISYAEENLARASARAVEESIFGGKGDTDKQFKGITTDKDVKVIKTEEITLDTFIDMHNALHPEFLQTAKWYMSTEVYSVVSKLKDGNQHPYVQNGIVNGKLTKTLFEIPISVSDYLPKEKPVVLGSMDRGYTVMIKQGMTLEHITNDMANALKGTQTLVLDSYMDGAVHDPQAFIVLESTSKVEG